MPRGSFEVHLRGQPNFKSGTLEKLAQLVETENAKWQEALPEVASWQFRSLVGNKRADGTWLAEVIRSDLNNGLLSDPNQVRSRLFDSSRLPYPRFSSTLGQLIRKIAKHDLALVQYIIAAYWVQQGWADRSALLRSQNIEYQIRFATAEALLSFCALLPFRTPNLEASEGELEQVEQARADLEQVIADLAEHSNEMFETIDRARKTFDEQFADAKLHLQLVSEAADGALEQARAKWDDEFGATLSAYKHKLQYEAPVSLWARLSEGHLSRAKWLLRGFVGAILVTIFGGAVAGYFWAGSLSTLISERVCEEGSLTDCSVLIRPDAPIIIGALLLASSLLLWLFRFLNKLYLSERHLGLDASQRKAFAETYLALIQDQTVDRQHEAIVLAALFRSSGDGIIKDDDGNIDVSAAALLSRLLQPRS